MLKQTHEKQTTLNWWKQRPQNCSQDTFRVQGSLRSQEGKDNENVKKKKQVQIKMCIQTGKKKTSNLSCNIAAEQVE